MKVLLDTNIIIHRETKDPNNKDIGKLFFWIEKMGFKKYIHNITIREISNNQNEKAKKAFLIKLQSYKQLPTTAPLKPEVQRISNKYDKNQNDKNDTILLNELYSERIDLLISEDKDIHRKAVELKIEDKVYTIEEFIEKAILENPEFLDYDVLSINKEFFGNIKLEDGFFNSFREDYKNFDKWFNKKSDEVSYTCKSEDDILAFLYLKIENENEPYPDIKPTFTRKKRLKIGSFKVSLNGFNIGERLLKIAFDNALQFSVDEIYVTIFTKRIEEERLINLLENFGFKYHGTKQSDSGIESVYVRDFSKTASISSPKITFPFIPKNTRKFIVPIRPEYHTNLIPDSILNTESPSEFIKNKPHRNAISKIYVSRSINRDLKTGDLIIFYRTGGYHKSVITTIGVVEEIHKSIKEEEEFIRLCRKRSVFTDDELKRQWKSSTPYNRPFIVKFLCCYSFPKRINMKRLIELGVIKDIESAPRGFEEISQDHFNKIIEETSCNDNIIVS